MKKSETKVTASEWNSRMTKQARELVRSGRMPSFEQVADAIAQSPAAQKLLATRLTERVGEQKN